jgi:hypothetical protein
MRRVRILTCRDAAHNPPGDDAATNPSGIAPIPYSSLDNSGIDGIITVKFRTGGEAEE